jgi:hypothetical protein
MITVDAGVNLLDRDFPGWAEKIDLLIFDMSKLDSCILGQLFEGYHTGLDKLGVPRYTDDDIKCGFDVPNEEINSESYKILTEEWIKRVRDRL